MIIMLALKSEEESKDTIKTTKHLLTVRGGGKQGISLDWLTFFRRKTWSNE